MDTVWMVLGGIAGLALGLVGGFKLGGLIRGRASWSYWLLNIVTVIAGVAAVMFGLAYGIGWLVGGALGLEGGALTGLKYGFGRSVGLWAVHDRALGNDQDLPRE